MSELAGARSWNSSDGAGRPPIRSALGAAVAQSHLDSCCKAGALCWEHVRLVACGLEPSPAAHKPCLPGASIRASCSESCAGRKREKGSRPAELVTLRAAVARSHL
eukprot:6435146-Alexandrium_andersonii.AAC.1